MPSPIIGQIINKFSDLTRVISQSNLLDYFPSPLDNPLKGFLPSVTGNINTKNSFSHSLEYGSIPLRTVMTSSLVFGWDAIESTLNMAASNSCNSVFRIYIDFPHLLTGIPQYLLDGGLVIYPYIKGSSSGSSPDWEDLNLQTAMANFITAFGAKYDGDPRIAFIEVGLLGFYGEWDDFGGPPWASLTTQGIVLNAYTQSFTNTKLLVPWPAGINQWTTSLSGSTQYRNDNIPVGYHDEQFCYNTIHPSSGYMYSMTIAGQLAIDKWKTYPFGGEVDPSSQICMWNTPPCTLEGNDFISCVNSTHASWVLNGNLFNFPPTSSALTNALSGSALLGYEFSILSSSFCRINNEVIINVSIKNAGVAPFYYPWTVVIGLSSLDGILFNSQNTSWDITSILPGNIQNYSTTLPCPSNGKFVAMIQIPNPMTGGKAIRFANKNQDITIKDWCTLEII